MLYETKPNIITYSFEVTVYHLAGVKVAEPFSDIAQLLTGLCVGKLQQKEYPRVCVYLRQGVL